MKRFPLINFIILFCFGILTEYYFKFLPDSLFYVLPIVIFLAVLIYMLKKIPFRLVLLNILAIVMVFLIGAFHFRVVSDSIISYPFKQPRIKNAVVYGEIKSVELPQTKKLSFTLSVDSLKNENAKAVINFNMICNLKDLNKRKFDEILNDLSIGNKIQISGSIFKPRNRRNPGEFDYEEYLNRNNISALLSFGKKDSLVLTEYSPDFSNYIFDARLEINRIFKELNNEVSSAFLKGILLADRGEIDFETRERFVNAGVVHILAVSGLHVGFIVLIFIVISSRFNIYIRSGITIIGLILFLLITNHPASVFRATIMGVTLIITFLANRKFNSYNALAIAAFIILVIDPSELFNPGFQLSFSAVLSIVAIYPILSRAIYKLKINSNLINKVLLFCAVSLAAQIGTLPFTILYFNKLSVVALFANLLVIPLVAVIVSTGIVTLIVYAISEWAASVYAAANDFFIFLLHSIVDFAGSSTISHISVFQFSLLDAVIFYFVLIIGFILYEKMRSIKAKIIFFVLIILNFIILIQVDNSQLLPDGKLSIMAIDIGQGDATLIKFPNNQTALVDAGNATQSFDNGEMIIYPLFNRLGIDSIDYGFITHVDADHYRGFLSLFKKGIIKKIFKPSLETDLEKDVRLDSLIRSIQIPLEYYHNNLFEFGSVKFYVLNDSIETKKLNLSTNDNSGIFKIIFGKTSFLLTGDAGFKTEEYLIDRFDSFLESDVFKIGHHGSKHSTSVEFLEVVDPEYGLISAGVINKFNHPTTEVLERLKSKNIKIQRTDLSGAVIYISDGKNIEIIDWRD